MLGTPFVGREGLMAVIHTDDSGFKKAVLEAKLPVLVDFYADWCGPCKMVAPVVDELSKEYDGKMLFVKVNIDNAQSTATKYGVMSIPTIMFFKGGSIIEQIVGALSKSQLKSKLEGHL